MTKAQCLDLWCLVRRVCAIRAVPKAERTAIRQLALRAAFGDAAVEAGAVKAEGGDDRDPLEALDAVLGALTEAGVRWDKITMRVNRWGRATGGGAAVDRDLQQARKAG